MESMQCFTQDKDLRSLLKLWYEELEVHKKSFSEDRYEWLQGLSSDSTVIKVAVMEGYLIGLRECNKDIGSLINLIRFIKAYLEDNK